MEVRKKECLHCESLFELVFHADETINANPQFCAFCGENIGGEDIEEPISGWPEDE